MCKYCKLEQGVPGERLNGNQTIDILRDGSLSVELTLNRYVNDVSGFRECVLILEQSVDFRCGNYVVQDVQIPIKYCPFCGEEL